jgi:hypothetical protein
MTKVASTPTASKIESSSVSSRACSFSSRTHWPLSRGGVLSRPFGVGLGGGDLQQWHQLADSRQPVLDQAVVAELEEFLDPDAL